MNVIHLNKAAFEKLTSQSEKCVLIDFWATWCGPCQKLAPELEKIAALFPDLIVGKINVDDPENIPIAVSLGVNSIPALFFYRNGSLENSSVGCISADEIIAKFKL